MREYDFSLICTKLDLGKLDKEVVKCSGGITNQIYKCETSKGIYAIKILNNQNILKDKNILIKIEKSEKISNIAKENGINTVNAIKFNDSYIQNIDGEYILVYDWCNGIVLKTCEITCDNVAKVAEQLAKLHKLKVYEKVKLTKYNKINYRYYYNLLSECSEEWCKAFKDKIDYLEKIYQKVYSCYSVLEEKYSYCHKDLNRKNILWSDDVPYLIDFETACIDNPYIDFFNSIWFLSADVQEDKFITFCNNYFKYMEFPKNINNLAYAGIIEECNWLEYSLKRVLGNDKSEVEIGKESILPSLTEIINYYEKVPLMLELMSRINKNN